ncbi:hypothetical protein D9M68_622680 [compost metagenome]
MIGFLLKRRFRKIITYPAPIKEGCSYLLMCNHFSFLDGLFAFYLCNRHLWGKHQMKKLYIMSLRQQMEKNPWLRYCGSFSVEPGKRSIAESFSYAAEILSEPGNVLLFFPQGNLESQHIRKIRFEDGINQIVPQIKGNCQLLWSSNIIEYFEGTQPVLTMTMLDAGTTADYDFNKLEKQINRHHRDAITRNFRYTEEEL